MVTPKQETGRGMGERHHQYCATSGKIAISIKTAEWNMKRGQKDRWPRGTRHIWKEAVRQDGKMVKQRAQNQIKRGPNEEKREEAEGCGNEDKMWGRQSAEDRGTRRSPESHQSKQLSLLICFNRAAVNELISGKRCKRRPYDGSVTAGGHRGPPGTKTHLTVPTLWIKRTLFSLIQSFSWISFFFSPLQKYLLFHWLCDFAPSL